MNREEAVEKADVLVKALEMAIGVEAGQFYSEWEEGKGTIGQYKVKPEETLDQIRLILKEALKKYKEKI